MPDPAQKPPQFRTLLGLALIVALVAAGWFVMRELWRADTLRGCVASGQANCAPAAATAPKGR